MFLAYAVRWWRVRRTLQAFSSLHRQELATAAPYQWPLILARQENEVKAIKAGKLDTPPQNIVDRKSWSYPFLPASINRLSVPIIKSTPYNLRRMSRTPVPHRAMSMIAGAIISQHWDIRPIADYDKQVDLDDQKQRIMTAKKCFHHPNNDDSFQTWIEMGLEDFHAYGGFVSEIRLTPDVQRPFKAWICNVESVRVFASWAESTPDMPRYAQMTGLKGERGALLFYDDEMMYIKDRPSSDNPFGLGCMEVGFASISALLGVQEMAGRAGADTIHKTWLWWEAPQSEAHVQIVRRYIQNELEGQAKLSLIAGMKKPEVIDVQPVTEGDLLLNWQELLIRMIGNAFRMSATALGIEHDVNRAIGQVLDDKDFRTAVVPTARRLMEAFTRKILHQKLGWYDLEFVFTNLEDPDIETMVEIYQKLYAMNASTPNRALRALGMEEMDSPLADLTQFECMLLNMEQMSKLKNQSADQAANRQVGVQQKMQDMQQQQQDQSSSPQPMPPGDPMRMTPANIAKGGQPPSPKPLALPKFPVAGSAYTAKQIAQMPVNQVTDVWKASGRLASAFLQSMDDQEPGILQTLTDEVKQFFMQQVTDEEQQHKKDMSRVNKKAVNRFKKELGVKVKQQDKRVEDLASYLRDVGQILHGRPDLAGRQPKAGKPGKLDKYMR